jgi:hypothetical protein
MGADDEWQRGDGTIQKNKKRNLLMSVVCADACVKMKHPKERKKK